MSYIDILRINNELKKLQTKEKELEKQISKLKEANENLDNKIGEERKRIAKPSQQLLILHHLGLLEPILTLNIQQKQKAKLLATLLNIGSENAEKNMGKLGTRKSEAKNEKNYDFIFDFFHSIGLKEKAKECGEIKKKLSDKKTI